MNSTPTLILLTGPSAIGKSFTARTIVTMFPDSFAFAPVHTTRVKRTDERRAHERIFVTEEEFNKLVRAGEFFAYETFAGYQYGYSKKHLNPKTKHLIIDVSPYLLPNFVQHANIVTIGLQAPDNFADILDQRMTGRGDSAEIRAARHPFIRRDIHDLEELEFLIQKHGKLFRVDDNRTIPDEVIPWVLEYFHLPATAATLNA